MLFLVQNKLAKLFFLLKINLIDVSSYIELLKYFNLNSNVEDEVAQKDMGPYADEDMTPIILPGEMP